MATTRILGLILMSLALPAAAQTETGPAPEQPTLTFGSQGGPSRSVIFAAFLGAQASPPYFGSDEMEIGPSFRAGLVAFRGFGLSFGEQDYRDDPYERRGGFGYGLSFRFIGARDSSDYDEIRGLDDIDPTLEIGGAVGYVWPSFEAILDTRYGFGGSDGWVSEASVNYVARPTDRLAIRFGPRVLFGSDNYVDTYFGVSSDESARSGLDRHDPNAGLVSAGLEAIATYRLGDAWWLEGAVQWEQFQGDAADSPIVDAGSDDRTQVRIGIRRALSLRF